MSHGSKSSTPPRPKEVDLRAAPVPSRVSVQDAQVADGISQPSVCPQALAVPSPLITANERPRADSQHKHTIVYSGASCQSQRRSINTHFSPSWRVERRNDEERRTCLQECRRCEDGSYVTLLHNLY